MLEDKGSELGDRFVPNRCQRASSKLVRREDKVHYCHDFEVVGDELFLLYSMTILTSLKQLHPLELVRRLSVDFCLQKCQSIDIFLR